MAELKNTDPEVIQDLLGMASDLLVSYGWYVLGAVIGLVFVWNRFLSQTVSKLSQTNEDPEVELTRAEQMERARRRQQEIYDKQMEEFKQKEEQKKIEKKRQLSQLENSIAKSVNSDNDLRKRNSKPLRDNSFNPLMGSSSGSSFRPSRSCGPSGGG